MNETQSFVGSLVVGVLWSPFLLTWYPAIGAAMIVAATVPDTKVAARWLVVYGSICGLSAVGSRALILFRCGEGDAALLKAVAMHGGLLGAAVAMLGLCAALLSVVANRRSDTVPRRHWIAPAISCLSIALLAMRNEIRTGNDFFVPVPYGIGAGTISAVILVALGRALARVVQRGYTLQLSMLCVSGVCPWLVSSSRHFSEGQFEARTLAEVVDEGRTYCLAPREPATVSDMFTWRQR